MGVGARGESCAAWMGRKVRASPYRRQMKRIIRRKTEVGLKASREDEGGGFLLGKGTGSDGITE